MYRPITSPQSIGGVLDDGFRLYRATLTKVLLLAFLALLVGQLPNLTIWVAGAATDGVAGVLVSFVVSMVGSLYFYGAMAVRMNSVAEGRRSSLGEALGQGGRRLPALLGFGLLYGLVLGVCVAVMAGAVMAGGAAGVLIALLVLVPATLFGVSLMFGTFPIVLEGQGPIEGLLTSHRLVWGHWWRTFVILSVASVVLMAAYLLIGFAAGFFAAFGGAAVQHVVLVQALVAPVLGAVVVPLFYAMTLAIYYDLRLRRSGSDLEQRLGLGVPSGA